MTMFGGLKEFPVKLYWCELNQQIVAREPVWINLNDLGIGGYGYENIRLTMEYIGELD